LRGSSITTISNNVHSVKFLNNKYDEFFKGRLGAKRYARLEESNLGAFKLAREEGEEEDAAKRSNSNNWTIDRSVGRRHWASLEA